MSKKGPIKLSNLLQKGNKRFNSNYDFLKEREELIASHNQSDLIQEPIGLAVNNTIESKNRETSSITEESKRLKVEPTSKASELNNIVNEKIEKVNNQIANRQQIDSNTLTNRQQLVNVTVNKIDVIVNKVFDYRLLSGNEKNLLYFVFHECLRIGSLSTSKLPISVVAKHLNVSENCAKVTIHRVVKKGFIYVSLSQKGRGGWSQYSISQDLYTRLQGDREFHTTDMKQITKQLTEQLANGSSSSSINIINKEETTTTVRFEDLPIEWRSIQTPENVKKYGFGQTQILSLFKKQVVTPDQIQESLNHLSFNLERNLVKSSIGPVGMLIGILNKGEVYVSTGYIEELEREAQKQKELIDRYEALKKEIAQNEIVKKFESFYSNLSKEERDFLSPPTEVSKSGSDMQMMQIRSLYLNSNGKLEAK